ncbi:fructosamine kinase family protein [Agromyces sp. MMS24-JH15]|uniref:fructosamine kinase family protein n=1 Tax=Agromyces sp. MMS24-JH15 TaxID=3243765 RepID=UPI0037480C93
MRPIRKANPLAPPGFFEAEAAGLAWLGEPAGGVRTARVLEVGPGRIVLERVVEVLPTRAVAHAFGRALAVTHDAGASAFGSPPEPSGAGAPLFIGRRPMPSTPSPTWGAFYARDRVLPFVDLAIEAGDLRDDEAALVRRACALVAEGAFDDGDAPARIHGDLWTGNVLWSPEGVVLIDPAAHGGHRETDLAMLALFGCPHLVEVVAGYEAVHPLRPGWRARLPLHQLHPLAVHAAGHGREYGIALADASVAVLELVEAGVE